MKKILFIIMTFTIVNAWSQKNEIIPELRNRKWGYINEKGEVVIDFQFEGVSDFSEGLAAVRKDGKYGYINRTGKTVIEFKFDFADDFKSSYARVAKDSVTNQKWGYISKDGTFALDYQFDYAENFSDNYAKVRKDTLSGLVGIDKKLFMGKWFYSVNTFPDGFIKVIILNNNIDTVLKEKYIVAYYDKKGNMLANKWFSGGGDFSDGMAKVSISDKCYTLDKKGNLKERDCDKYDAAAPVIDYLSGNDVDVNPEFPGGELGFRKYIAMNVRYPGEARENNIQGKVYVRFTIDPSGNVLNPEIVRSVNHILDNEVIRVIKTVPKWKPAIKDGKPVSFMYTVPVNFQIQ